ncbi:MULTISPECIES: IS3 family transposase [Listeria]|nr:MULTISPECIES: IS3 family transposase [Listeria]UVD70118.1 IS3 family transposase [Listeria innocua]WCT26908.1 IS3 family transposase [Listeria innocua]
MSNYKKYDEDFKKSLVNLYNGGKTQAALCKEYGVSQTALSRWIKLYSEVQMESGELLTVKQVRELQKQKALLEEENLILKKANCHLHATLEQRLKAISLLATDHSIVRLCQVLRVNRSTYYKFLSKIPSARSVENQQIKRIILQIYTETKFRLGAAKIKIVLQRDYGISISIGRVYRLMKTMDLPKMSTVKPRFRYQKPTVSSTCPNLLKQQFHSKQPNRIWVSDISYIPVKKGFVYLCVILDIFSRKVIAWNVYASMTAKLVCDTVERAVHSRNPVQSVIFHSDRGSQYLSQELRQVQEKYNLIPSYSKLAYPWDNAVTESFFKYMKKEELNRRNFSSLEEVKLACFEYIEGFYNSKRPHSANNFLSPNLKELAFLNDSS